MSFLPPANEVWGKVIFSQASVILLMGGSASVHAGIPPSRETPLQGEPPSRENPLQRDPPPGRPSLQGNPPSRPTPRGEIEGDQIQTHSQGGNWGGSGPGPQPRGKLRGIRSRLTPKGEIEGDQIQANTQWGNWGGSDPDPRMTTTAAGGTHPTGMHSCLHWLSFWCP